MAARRRKRVCRSILDSSDEDSDCSISPTPILSQSSAISPSKVRVIPSFVPIPSPKKPKLKQKQEDLFEDLLLNSQGPLSGLNLLFLSTITTTQRNVFSQRCLELGARIMRRIRDLNNVKIHLVSSSSSKVTLVTLKGEIGIDDDLDQISKNIDNGNLICVTEKWVINVLKNKSKIETDHTMTWVPLLKAPVKKLPLNQQYDVEEKVNSSQRRPSSNLNINYGRSWDNTTRLGTTTTNSTNKDIEMVGGGGGGYNHKSKTSYSSSEEEYEADIAKRSISFSGDLYVNDVSQVTEIGRKMPSRLKNKLACQSNGENSIVNKNEHITKILDEMAVMHGSTTFANDQWRVVALKKASKILKQLPYHVESVEQIKGMKGIGQKTVTKIEEILETKTLARLQHLQQDPVLMAVAELSTVWGVGTRTARELVTKQNIFSVKALKDRIADDQTKGRIAVVNDTVIKTVNVYDDLIAKIPRAEVEAIRESVLPIANEILAGMEVQVVGSYRRGNASSGDVDMLFTHSSWHGSDGSPEEATRETYHKRKKFLTVLTNRLLDIGLLAFHITDPATSNGGEHFSTSYMGVTAPQEGRPKHRRIDMKCYPVEEMPFALLYFTGNAYFNRSMRWFAKRKGLTLSDHGMAECVRQKNVGKIFIKDSVRCSSEKDIFDFLGLVYLSPRERECNGKVVEAFGGEAPPPVKDQDNIPQRTCGNEGEEEGDASE